MTADDPARRPPTGDSGGAARSGTPGTGEPADDAVEVPAPKSDVASGADPDTSDSGGGAPAGDTAGADAVRTAETGPAAGGTGTDGTDPVTEASAAATNGAGSVVTTGPDAGATVSGAAGADSSVTEPDGGVPGPGTGVSAVGARGVGAGPTDPGADTGSRGAHSGATGSESVAARRRPIDWGDDEIAPAAEAGTARGGRQPVTALALLALGAAALWGSSRLTWVTVTSADGLTEPRTDELNGGVWFGALTPLALVLLAAIAAVLATRGWMRRLVGVVVALIAAVTAVPALALLTGSGATEQRATDLAGLPGRAQVQELVTSSGPAALTLCGALAAFGAGLLLARMPAGTKQLSGKYDNPATRKAAATQAVQQRGSGEVLPERVLWDALDAGADPTDPTSPDAPDAPDAAADADAPDAADKPVARPAGSVDDAAGPAVARPANETARSAPAGSVKPADRDATARDTDRPDAPRPGDTP
ncbi:TIGR02234 family membrane protein [Nocardia sp. NPDC058499]|uniref:TIGR02234 family membrane protein n=1 Tax=Nocardia sp. NPDC058499 TaxID=3346530 RepID=UPI00364633BC